MGLERRRAGFRLPWSTDAEETDETGSATTEMPADGATASADTDSAEAVGATATASTEPMSPDAGAADAEPMSSTPSSAVTGSEHADPAGTAGTGATDADAIAGMTAAAGTNPESESDDFLKNLVGAMRGVAETSRDASLAELRTAIDERIEKLRSAAAERETDIRRQADTDLEAVGEWERTEIDRVRGEAETKRTDRRARLEQQLAEHRTASERAVETAQSRLAQHENELAAFFAQLSEITDPAAFVAAAKRMPRAPELDATAAPSVESTTEPVAATEAEIGADTATAPIDPRLAALGVAVEVAPATEPTTGHASVAETPDGTPTDEAAGSTNGTGPTGDGQLAERLAQLDERLSGAQPPSPVAAVPAGAETSTAIVVKGLGSFGAITSFKQSLERVEGIRGVTLSLGPTGEFVYRASHAGDFDLVAAIQGLEGPTASIENTDGTLVVTLSRAR